LRQWWGALLLHCLPLSERLILRLNFLALDKAKM
jgi:hypothetical protein